MLFHKILEKQIKKYLTDKNLDVSDLHHFLEAINNSYNAFERDKSLSEHAFNISEQEYFEVNEKLKSEITLKVKSIKSIIHAIQLIDENFIVNAETETDILAIVNYLNKIVDKLQQTDLEIKKAITIAENANMAKSNFLSVMSHEIRTPLNAVIGMAFLLQMDDPKPEQLENLRVLKISADNLLALINDLLDLGKIEAGKIELENDAFSLQMLLLQLKSTHHLKAIEKNIDLSLEYDNQLPEKIIGDSLRLNQILNNLLSNAIKFTQQGYITIHVKLLSKHENKVRIYFAVSDTGVGIEKEKQNIIFESFSQATSATSRKYGGTGLGLTITKKIINLMQGEIEVNSKLNEGSTFSFELGFDLPEESNLSIDTTSVEYNLSQMKILIVDDIPENLLFIVQLLISWKALVTTCNSGNEAIQLLRQNQFDMVLMDIFMPEMDGYETSKHIRTFNKQIPIIALSASANKDMKKKANQSGMQNYLAKPFKPMDLFRMIQTCKN